jgi:hypothetical protein
MSQHDFLEMRQALTKTDVLSCEISAVGVGRGFSTLVETRQQDEEKSFWSTQRDNEP